MPTKAQKRSRRVPMSSGASCGKRKTSLFHGSGPDDRTRIRNDVESLQQGDDALCPFSFTYRGDDPPNLELRWPEVLRVHGLRICMASDWISPSPGPRHKRPAAFFPFSWPDLPEDHSSACKSPETCLPLWAEERGGKMAVLIGARLCRVPRDGIESGS
ncbi:hypothetical protein V8C44DRAFT_317300 [Trichoderma aethiopicum]